MPDASSSAEDRPTVRDRPTTLRVTVTGQDRPGLTSQVFRSLSSPAEGVGVEVLDVEQVVVRDQLILAALLAVRGDPEHVIAAVRRAGVEAGLHVGCEIGEGDTATRAPSRLHVTLMGSPLQPAAIAGVTELLARRAANIDRVRRLSRTPVVTVELDVSSAVDHTELPALRRELAALATDLEVDVAVSRAGLARQGRRLVVMDVDSTLITGEVIELLAAHAGRADEVAAVTERAMRGELDFAESLHERVACLAGLPVSVFEQVLAAVELTPGARTLVRTLRRLGFTVALVSGGFIEIVGPLAASLGVEHARANRLETADGVLTGRVAGPVVDRATKATVLRELAAAEGLPMSRTVAIGDGANDLDMIAAAGLGVAFNAKPVVREQADAAVSGPHLDAVLHLLGITREEIEAADAEDPPGV